MPLYKNKEMSGSRQGELGSTPAPAPAPAPPPQQAVGPRKDMQPPVIRQRFLSGPNYMEYNVYNFQNPGKYDVTTNGMKIAASLGQDDLPAGAFRGPGQGKPQRDSAPLVKVPATPRRNATQGYNSNYSSCSPASSISSSSSCSCAVCRSFGTASK